MSGLQTTPDHPPYAWMIEMALQELDEGGGCNEDLISEFIMKNIDSLPRAHTTILKHHLEKMCERGEIVMIDGGRTADSETRIPREKERAREGGRERALKGKEDGAKKGDGTPSSLATKEPDDQRERALKGQEDRADLDVVLMKDLRLSRRSKMIKD
ncbi:hypothetical protein KY285_020048 [Solanum tuberosum]|nr:hypothetical protein KY285_020048 [Solanum tuberosum]